MQKKVQTSWTSTCGLYMAPYIKNTVNVYFPPAPGIIICATILSSNTTISELKYFKWPKWPLIYRRKSIYYCDMLNLLSKPCVISANFENGTVTEDSKCTSINFFYELLKFLWLTIGLTFQIVAQKMEKWDYISPRSPKIHWRPFRFLRRRFIFL